jgi:hypothetical protein
MVCIADAHHVFGVLWAVLALLRLGRVKILRVDELAEVRPARYHPFVDPEVLLLV